MNNDKIIDGNLIANEIKEEIKLEAGRLKEERGIVPGLAFILVGNNPASQIYVKSKGKTCNELGFYSVTEELPEDIDESVLLDLINKFNNDSKIHGILVQLPLPSHIDETKILEAIDYRKDVDGFHPQNIGRLVAGKDCFYPCTPFGIIELLRRSKIETQGKSATIIGRSNIVGKPLANLLLRKEINCTVSVCHSGTSDIRKYTLNSDIIIVAIGKPEFLKADMINEGCVIIDVGINRLPDSTKKSGYRIVGDVDFKNCYEKSFKITPVPGGVGPMTIAMLMKNTLLSAKGEVKF
ncbi:MAG: bifunctional methylenetetrahydrofolate dehydrogenase/methenyltetrahydrofolate cyclohydrolase FolD [Ignavibacteria bacterium]|nr:bifunctional methylenetetrahydrofolate dehydrogenase/methenyltetrahydrofolate cyclohydrolase FolD [Ignavibacteria bacterium]